MKMTRDHLCHLITDRYVEAMSLQELQDVVAVYAHEDYMLHYTDSDLLREAIIYGIIGEDETLEIES